MEYTIKAHPTMYAGVRFRSRLEARWAALFDLLEVPWEYEPIDFVGWTPDFLIKLECTHSECCAGGFNPYWRLHDSITHDLFVEVKPLGLAQVKQFHSAKFSEQEWDTPSPAVFGLDPAATLWVMSHGAGGGEWCFAGWHGSADFEFEWREAGNRVQWHLNKQQRES